MSHVDKQNRRDAVERNNFLAHMSRRTAPPRFRPAVIIILVISMGMLFIGLTITIIANWPGYSSPGGNPMKIAGPAVLAAGGVVLIAVLINICIKMNKDKKKLRRDMRHMDSV